MTKLTFIRKLITFTVFFSILNSSYSQVSKGQWLVGGSGRITFTKQGIFSGSRFTLAPSGGYFLMDKLTVGTRVEFTRSSTKVEGSSVTKEYYWGLQPFARYYLLPKTSLWNPFAEAGGTFRRMTDRGISDEVYKENQLGYSAAGGLAFFLHTKISLESRLSYDYFKVQKSTSDPSNNINVNIGLQVHL